MNIEQPKWYFIVNPHAGSGKTMSKWIPAEKMLYSNGVNFTTSYTDHKRHAEELAYEAASQGWRYILAVGGDGSAHEAYSGIMKWCLETGTSPEEFTIGVFPIGSGNDWIKSLGFSKDTEEVVSLITDCHTVKMDTVVVEDTKGKKFFMLNIGGVGFDSHVCQRVNVQKESGMRGARIYFKALIHTIKTLKTIRLQIISDGQEIYSGECYSVALGNGKYSGSGMRQVPDATINDGMIDIMVCPKIPLTHMLKNLHNLFNGDLASYKELIFGRGKEISILPLDSMSEDVFELDGEVEGRIGVKFTVLDSQINAIGG